MAAILVMAMLNGLLREKILLSWLEALAALVASGLLLSVIVFLIAWLAIPSFGTLTPARYWGIGLPWLGLTLVFEFGFGHFVQRQPLSELLRAYTFRDGNIWPLVLVSVLASPWLAAQLRAATT